MKWVGYTLLFAAGFAVGAIVTREIAIGKIEGPINAGVDALLGPDTYASGQIKTSFNSFLRDN